MQFHLNGYRTGDPNIAPEADRSGESFDKVDVLIVGCGPAGLTLAAQMSAFADTSTRIIDVKPGPLTVGQADGVACRSMEMFQAFGFAEQVKQEAYWVNEVAFWKPADTGDVGLTRANRIQDVEDNLSEMPHTILNQARIHDFYLDIMQQSPRRLVPDYGRSLLGLKRDDTKDYPIEATLELADGSNEVIHAHYVVGCDGARSNVRRALGYELKGEAARQLWGVMDVLAVTDFPDIRLKAAIQSADQGSMLIIPREGGYMVRLYIEVGELHEDERAADRKLTIEELIEKAQLILSPYQLDVKDVVWWSAYEIGQRVCDSFDDMDSENGLVEPRIFIAGDACHTHSPKAGQGMNVSMADTFNLGWKLAAVVRKQASKALLNTYSQERQSKAQELIDFDRDMARLFSAKSSSENSSNTADAEKFQQYFKKHGRFTAGVETQYQPSIITGHSEYQALALGFPIGKRFHSAPVIRLADAKPVELGHVMKADGRWRLMVFSPRWIDDEMPATILALCDYLLSNPRSPVVRYTPKNADIDSVIDLRMVLQENHRHVSVNSLPELLLPRKGRYGLIDYEKVFCANVGCKDIGSDGVGSGGDVFNIRGIDRENGALIVVRPDQYVSGVLPLTEFALLEEFFAGFQIVSV